MAKLMEHSWWGNYSMDCAVQYLLDNGPLRLAWVGDYVEQEDFTEEEFKELRRIPKSVKVPRIEKIWGRNSKPFTFEAEFVTDLDGNRVLKNPIDLKEYFLVNHDQKVYVDCEKYYKEAQKKSSDSWVVHPLSLLTVVGNGRGGGDYHPNNSKDAHAVGSWAWNLIEVCGEIPEGYSPLNVVFYE